jgi:hypothetical protein
MRPFQGYVDNGRTFHAEFEFNRCYIITACHVRVLVLLLHHYDGGIVHGDVRTVDITTVRVPPLAPSRHGKSVGFER